MHKIQSKVVIYFPMIHNGYAIPLITHLVDMKIVAVDGHLEASGLILLTESVFFP